MGTSNNYKIKYCIDEYGIVHGKRIILDTFRTYSASEYKRKKFEMGRECRDIETYTTIEEI